MPMQRPSGSQHSLHGFLALDFDTALDGAVTAAVGQSLDDAAAAGNAFRMSEAREELELVQRGHLQGAVLKLCDIRRDKLGANTLLQPMICLLNLHCGIRLAQHILEVNEALQTHKDRLEEWGKVRCANNAPTNFKSLHELPPSLHGLSAERVSNLHQSEMWALLSVLCNCSDCDSDWCRCARMCSATEHATGNSLRSSTLPAICGSRSPMTHPFCARSCRGA
eukprot:5930108-Amphidinium_carterae.7